MKKSFYLSSDGNFSAKFDSGASPAVDSAVALSGGVDSATAAALLQQEGRRPLGIFLRHRFQPTLTEEESALFFAENGSDARFPVYALSDSGRFERSEYAPTLFPLPRDAAAALSVAQTLGIPFALFNADPIFRRVTSDFVENYLDGRTPNPCVLCNRILKFGALIDLAESLGAKEFATGHYVRRMTKSDYLAAFGTSADAFSRSPLWTRQSDESAFLVSVPNRKDQSYFLWGIERERIARLRFPIGRMEKDEVRRIAAEFQLPTPSGGESQDVCFIPNGKNLDFVREYGDGRETAGEFVSLDGAVIGRHAGYEKFTVGQRKGLGTGFGERIFVQRIDADARRVVLGPYDALGRTEVSAERSNWLVDLPFGESFRAEVKIRCRSHLVPATVTADSDGSIRAEFDEARFGVAPGQSLAVYCGSVLLGGGVLS